MVPNQTRNNRIVALLDMDCFYCQVEARSNPSLQNCPLAVVQYNEYRLGGIIAVNYEARAFGVKRGMWGDEAIKLCPDLKLARVPQEREKANLSHYRAAGKEVIDVLISTFPKDCITVERASIDEAYLDLTKLVEKRQNKFSDDGMTNFIDRLDNTFIADQQPPLSCVGSQKEILKNWLSENNEDDVTHKLLEGAAIMNEMRQKVYEITSFRCSAGISVNKVLAKLACGLNKPNKQTILPFENVESLFKSVKINKVRGLGGKLGRTLTEIMNCRNMGDIKSLTLSELATSFDSKTSQWIYQICRGFDDEPVNERNLPKSIGCSKNFLGPNMLDTCGKVRTRMTHLLEEVYDRLIIDRETNCRRQARTLTLCITQDAVSCRGLASKEESIVLSRTISLDCYDLSLMIKQTWAVLLKFNENSTSNKCLDGRRDDEKGPGDVQIDVIPWKPKLKNIGIYASKFDTHNRNVASVKEFFNKSNTNDSKIDEITEKNVTDESINDDTTAPNTSGVSTGIDRFFKSSRKLYDDNCQEPSNETSEEHETVVCEECSQRVSPFFLPEHLDFHVAQKLQSELRLQDRPPVIENTFTNLRDNSSSSKSAGCNSKRRKLVKSAVCDKHDKKQSKMTKFLTFPKDKANE